MSSIHPRSFNSLSNQLHRILSCRVPWIYHPSTLFVAFNKRNLRDNSIKVVFLRWLSLSFTLERGCVADEIIHDGIFAINLSLIGISLMNDKIFFPSCLTFRVREYYCKKHLFDIIEYVEYVDYLWWASFKLVGQTRTNLTRIS